MGSPEHIKVGANSSLSRTASGSFALAGYGEPETENLHTNIAPVWTVEASTNRTEVTVSDNGGSINLNFDRRLESKRQKRAWRWVDHGNPRDERPCLQTLPYSSLLGQAAVIAAVPASPWLP